MISYPFITDLFTNVLAKSKAIGGRFYLCPRNGNEINSDELEQVIQEVVLPATVQKYPLALLMPPRSRGKFTNTKQGEWESYRFIMFFLKTTYADSANQVIDRNSRTGTSMHSVPMDWHDMKRAATGFVRVLARVQRSALLINDKFRLDDDDRLVDPVSMIGKDRVSGVRLEFGGSLFVGCELEDYNESDLNSIIIPELDSHPEHKL
jgi:hypothetical protein